MAGTFYKYAERDADSQINWAEVGKGLSDMLAETNRVREEKKDALDAAQRETMNYLAETPNGEHIGARESILEYANMGSNQMRIMKQLMEQGQLDVKDYTIFRQNLTDNTNLAFNANKLYQEKYADVMKGVADKKYSQLYADNFAEVEGFGNWKNIGWQIAPNGVVMAGKMIEQEVDGKKVRTLDKTPGSLRSMDYLNQSLVSQVDFYQYEDKVNAWVETLGKEKKTTTMLGNIQKQGKITSVEDITSRKDIDPSTKQVLFTFLQGENDQIDSIVGEPFDAARVLVDSAIFAPNRQQYRSTTSEEDAKKNPEAILKVVDPDTGGFKYVISKEQQKDVNEFVRGQMRAKYNYEEDAQVVGAVARDEESEGAIKRREEQKEKDNALGTWGDVFKATTPAGKQAALETILGSKLAQDRGLLDIDTTSQPGKITFKYADPVKNRTLDYDPNTTTLRQWNELGNEVHGIDNVADVMKRNKGGDPNMRMNAQQRNFAGVKAGRTPVKDPVVEFSNKVSNIKKINVTAPDGEKAKGIAYLTDKAAAVELAKILKGTGIDILPNPKYNPFNTVTLKAGEEEYKFKVGYDSDETEDAETAMDRALEFIEANTSAEKKKELLAKGLTGGLGKASKY
jgi:hypothetical protein